MAPRWVGRQSLPEPAASGTGDPPNIVVRAAEERTPGVEHLEPRTLKSTSSIAKPPTKDGVAAHNPAHVWHALRRAELLQHQSVRDFIRVAVANRSWEAFLSSSVAVAVIGVHAASALAIKRLSASPNAPRWAPALIVAGASATLGAQCAFLIQALNHELSHALPVAAAAPRDVPHQIAQASLLTLGVGGAALCHVPWAAYYFSGTHQRHHRFAGSRRDVDAEALFFLWQTPLQGTAMRFCWLSAAAIVSPLSYAFSLAKYSLLDWRANIPEIRLMGLDWVLTGVVCRKAGRYGAAYLLLSSFFSMGFLAHPLIGFWILQHLCVEGKQPTVSYYGSSIWNLLCLNELYHVEHHDFAGLSWRKLPKLRELVPDLYDQQHFETSIRYVVYSWLCGGDPRFEHDFACRNRWGFVPCNMPGSCGPTAQKDVKCKALTSTPERVVGGN